jgi:simple sugar transport system ATP-binding protein
VLTPQEIEELMRIMRGLASEGKSILFITHKLAEIMAVADRCTVLRKGRSIATVDVRDSSPEELAEMMVGRKISFTIDKQPARPGEAVLSVENLSVQGRGDKKAVDGVSFEVRAGEIVCIAGIDGNGQSELVYALTGLMPSQGRIALRGRQIDQLPIRRRNDQGMAHIPEDRHKYGLILDYDLQQNLSLKRYLSQEMQRRGFIRFDRVRSYAQGLIERFDIRSGQGPDTLMRSMSGGNQQKTIVAREIDVDPEVLIAVQPTRGLDVGAMIYIHEQLVRVRDEGKAILLISLELDEVFQLADRILVIYEGKLVAELDAARTTQQELGLYMAGSKKQEASHA